MPSSLPGFLNPHNERELMLFTAAFVWSATAIGIFVFGFIAPEVAPSDIWTWRIVLLAIAVTGIVSELTWMRRLDDVRVFRVMNFWNVVFVSLSLSLMLGNPLSIGPLMVALMVPVVFVANFLSKRAAIAQVGFVTVAALLPVIIHYEDAQSQHLLSRVSAIVPIMWSVAVAVYALRSNRESALAASERVAYSDPLTGVANARAVQLRAEKLLSKRNARIAGATGLLLIDLDDFKSANTLHGHVGGDHLLRTVAAGLARAASANHLVARIGGDEFVVLIENVDPRDLDDLAIRYRNAVRAVRNETALPGVEIDASVGSAITPKDGSTLEDLMTAADRSMYKIKADHHESSAEKRGNEAPSQLPNEFLTPPSEPQWLTPEDLARKPEKPHSLNWSDRPAYARFAALTWAVGVTIGLFSLAMPDAERTHLLPAVAGLLAGYLVAAIAYVTAPEIGSWRHLANDVFTLCGIAFISYLTGGSDSPLWPLVYLFIIYEAWFLDAQQIWFRLLGPIAVILLPLTYEPWSSIGAANGAAMYSGVLVAVGLTLAMSYNQYFLRRARVQARRLAKIDSRTNLANRREFERRVQLELSALNYGSKDALAIVMLDLDNFKNVNTAHGHKAGDELLVEIAEALSRCARADDCVARVGGDEFAVVIPGVDAATAQLLARRFVEAVADCTAQSALPACRAVTASAGFALFGMHGRTLDELVHAADVALMSVKTSGKGVERVSSFVVSL